MSPSEREKLTSDIKSDEGCILHAYQDSQGYWTIGYGRLIDLRRGGGISRDEAEMLLTHDIARAEADLDRYVPWWQQLDHVRQRALINMCFQMGIGSAHDHTGLLAFERLLAALRTGDWTGAYRETLDSQYAREVPTRAKRIANAFLNGDTNVS